jgi:hypothetical protein
LLKIRVDNPEQQPSVGIAYFLNDGIDKEKTEALFYELLENITNFNNLGYNKIPKSFK